MKRWILQIGLVAAACIAAVELAGAAYFLWQTGGLIYLNRGPADANDSARSAEHSPFKQRLHPYFGFTFPYDVDANGVYTNDAGFMQRERVSLPFTPAPDDFVVVVTGGSVAIRLVMADMHGVPLRDALQAVPAMAGKRVVLISMAQGAQKQPQHLLALAYLLALGQRIDFVINIDGFNEFALGYQNDREAVDPVLPAVQLMIPLALELADSPAAGLYTELAHRISQAKNALARHSGEMHRARSGLGLVRAYLLASWDRRILSTNFRQYQALIADPNYWSGYKQRLGLDMPYQAHGLQVFDMLFDLWLRSSQQMKRLAEANGAGYLHVVQPNQYFSQHVFSAHEREVALSAPEKHEYRVGVEVGYRLLAERQATLTANGIVSAVDLFDNEREEIYSDGCCHYTAKGETLLAQFVAAEMERRVPLLPAGPRGH